MPAPAPPPNQDPPAPFDILNPPPPKPMAPEDDPNLRMAELIAKRETRQVTGEQAPGDEKGKEAEKAEDPAAKKATEDSIARFLNFRQRPKKQEGPKDEKAAEQSAPKEEERPKDEAEPKTIVKKPKQPAPVSVDTARIVSEATTAATREAMKGLREQQSKPVAAPGDALAEDDRHEYEVAQVLAQTNPKYRNAPQIVLDHVKKANAYAARWESQNPGKVYNPNDEEHADFHDSLDAEKPWSMRDFRKAEIKLDTAPEMDEKVKPLEDKIARLEQEQAQSALKEDVQNAHMVVAGALAKSVGDEVLDAITKEGWETFKKKKENRITAEVLQDVMASVQPITEALVMLDDPKRRVQFDPKNQAHLEYAKFFHDVEARYAGQTDEAGRMFARRADYQHMSAAEQARHWILTTQMIGAELVGDASKAIAERIQARKEQAKLDAEALGYGPIEQGDKPKPKTVASYTPPPENSQNGHPAPFKPNSPASSSGVAIDNTESAPTDPVARFLQRSAKVLYQR